VAWISVCCECCVLSGRGLCDELITRLEESYRLWCVVVCDLKTSWLRRPWPALVRSTTEKKINYKTLQTKHLQRWNINLVWFKFRCWELWYCEWLLTLWYCIVLWVATDIVVLHSIVIGYWHCGIA